MKILHVYVHTFIYLYIHTCLCTCTHSHAWLVHMLKDRWSQPMASSSKSSRDWYMYKFCSLKNCHVCDLTSDFYLQKAFCPQAPSLPYMTIAAFLCQHLCWYHLLMALELVQETWPTLAQFHGCSRLVQLSEAWCAHSLHKITHGQSTLWNCDSPQNLLT